MKKEEDIFKTKSKVLLSRFYMFPVDENNSCSMGVFVKTYHIGRGIKKVFTNDAGGHFYYPNEYFNKVFNASLGGEIHIGLLATNITTPGINFYPIRSMHEKNRFSFPGTLFEYGPFNPEEGLINLRRHYDTGYLVNNPEVHWDEYPKKSMVNSIINVILATMRYICENYILKEIPGKLKHAEIRKEGSDLFALYAVK